MRFHRLTQYLLGHRWQALLLTFLMTYVPLLGMLSIIVAAFFTLCVGVFEGALFTLAASLPYLLALASISHKAMTSLFLITVLLTISANVLTFVFAVMLRRGCSWSLLIQLAALFGAFVICMIHYFYPGVSDWWALQLQYFYNQSTQELAMVAKPGTLRPLGQTQMDSIGTIKYYATGVVTSFILFTALMQVLGARWWQLAVVIRARISRELQTIRLTRLTGILFLLALIFYYIGNRIILDILPVLFLLFGVAGLSLVHYLLTFPGGSRGRFSLSLLYIVLLVSLMIMALLPLFSMLGTIFPVMLAVLTLITFIFVFMVLAWFDVWMDIRKRVHKT